MSKKIGLTYTQEQLLACQQFSAREKELLNALLKDSECTLEQAKQLLKSELERVIK